jgi:hypothetical protein
MLWREIEKARERIIKVETEEIEKGNRGWEFYKTIEMIDKNDNETKKINELDDFSLYSSNIQQNI